MSDTTKQRILDNGYEDVVIFDDDCYDDALIGISEDNRAIYDFDLMVEGLIRSDDEIDETGAIEWIEYNVIRSLPYVDGAPIVMYRLWE